MLFNSGIFFFFFLCVFICYQFLSHRRQNYLLLVASYYFYAAWDYRFLLLILISTAIDYFAGLAIHREQQQQRAERARVWLYLSLISNLSILGFFKYFNFFADNLALLATSFGITLNSITLDIILPVGISFYTFQSMSYSIDIYRGRYSPTRSFLDFSLYVAFFPQLMAGPIERAKKLLPQIQQRREVMLSDFQEGGWLLFWGLFKKVYIADNLYPYYQWAFIDANASTSLEIYTALLAGSFMYYCDFSGYSDMARGMARMMGFRLSLNFNLPFLAPNPTELWRRWHITLGNWFRDYFYATVRRCGNSELCKSFSIFITMTMVGLWHGANWTYILWGAFWGLALVTHRLTSSRLQQFKQRLGISGLLDYSLGVLITFHLWMLFILFFLSNNLMHSLQLVTNLFINHTQSSAALPDLYRVLFYTLPLFIMQAFQYRYKDLLIIFQLSTLPRYIVYALLLLLIWVNGAENINEFLYFQF